MTVYTDDNNNRLNPPANPSPMVYDATDKLVTWPGQHQYTYYPTGSLHEQKNSGGTVQKTFAYTGAELLSSVTHAGVANPSLMEWDADSNRVSFTSSTGGTTEFVYDTTAGIPAVVEEETPSGSVYYIREPGGELIARMAGANKQYYHFDELGSTRKLTDKDGVVTDTYSYDAWGNTTHTGSTEQPYQYVGQLGYYTHWQDENLDLLQLGVRFYDPETGRFAQKDPIDNETSSPYAYGDDSPVLKVDPSGRFVMILPILIIVGAEIGLEYMQWQCVQRVFDEANDLLGTWRFPDADLLVHCYFTCKATRCLWRSPLRAWIMKKYVDYNHRGEGPIYDAHEVYNRAGLACGMGFRDCMECCEKAWGEKHGCPVPEVRQ